jgi:hypothetical protein
MLLLEYGERDDGQIKGLGKEYGRKNERNQSVIGRWELFEFKGDGRRKGERNYDSMDK